MKKSLLYIIAVILLTGCVGQTAYISSLTDASYAPTKLDPIFIIQPENAGIEDRRFYTLLKSEMKLNGFNIVENVENTKYLLVFETDSSSSNIDSVIVVPTTNTTTSYVGATAVTSTTTSSSTVPYSYNYTVEKLYLNLYSLEDIAQEKYITAWEGYIGAEQATYDKYLPAIMNSLFNVFGKNYQEHTRINRKYRKE